MNSDAITPTIESRREAMRHKFPKWYNGYLHFLFPNLFAWTGIATCFVLLDDVHWYEWLALPFGFMFANFMEWLVHKGPLHHKTDWMYMAFDRHTLSHHEYFQEDSMRSATHREWFYVLFPIWGIFAVFLPTVPVLVLSWYFLTPNVALLFMVIVFFYFILYEWLHLIYHLPAHWWISRQPFVAWLQTLHRNHHNKKLMTNYNFNVTFPITDWLMGTLYRPEAHAARIEAKRRPRGEPGAQG